MDDTQPVVDKTDYKVTPAPNVVVDQKRDEMTEEAPLTWTAAEYIHLEKGAIWFVVFGLVVLSLIALDIFLLHAYTFTALVIVMAVAMIIYVRRPPREIAYSLSSSKGLYVADKLYPYGEYKGFGIVHDGVHTSIFLVPTKRFSPGLSVYFPPELGDDISDILGSNLPMQDIKLDLIDRLIRLLRI